MAKWNRLYLMERESGWMPDAKKFISLFYNSLLFALICAVSYMVWL